MQRQNQNPQRGNLEQEGVVEILDKIHGQIRQANDFIALILRELQRIHPRQEAQDRLPQVFKPPLIGARARGEEEEKIALQRELRPNHDEQQQEAQQQDYAGPREIVEKATFVNVANWNQADVVRNRLSRFVLESKFLTQAQLNLLHATNYTASHLYPKILENFGDKSNLVTLYHNQREYLPILPVPPFLHGLEVRFTTRRALNGTCPFARAWHDSPEWRDVLFYITTQHLDKFKLDKS